MQMLLCNNNKACRRLTVRFFFVLLIHRHRQCIARGTWKFLRISAHSLDAGEQQFQPAMILADMCNGCVHLLLTAQADGKNIEIRSCDQRLRCDYKWVTGRYLTHHFIAMFVVPLLLVYVCFFFYWCVSTKIGRYSLVEPVRCVFSIAGCPGDALACIWFVYEVLGSKREGKNVHNLCKPKIIGQIKSMARWAAFYIIIKSEEYRKKATVCIAHTNIRGCYCSVDMFNV